MAKDKAHKEGDLEWQKRVLCSDEACIGVIGPDGRCKECGRVYEGKLPAAFEEYALEEDADPDIVDPADEGPVTTDDEIDTVLDDDAGETASPDESWENRILCSDENCIGVIGPDGRCKECGKPYAE